MSVKKRRRVVLIAVVAAVAVFCVSAFAAGVNFSGYERVKEAGFMLVEQLNKPNGFYSNGSYWTNARFYLNDAEVYAIEQITMRDGGKKYTQETAKYALNALSGIIDYDFGNMKNYGMLTYTDDDVTYRWFDDGSFDSYPIHRYDSYREYGRDNRGDNEEGVIPPAQRRFAEAVIDTLIGETRSYFVTQGNTIRISLSGNQIPELAQFAIAAVVERTSGMMSPNGGYGMSLGKDARFSSGLLEVELNDDGFAVGGKISFGVESTVNGSLQAFRFEAEVVSKNIGSTSLQKPNGNEFGRPVLPSADGDDFSDGITYAPGAAAI